ncbi:hypothetical protein [Candidatus Curculioniphilus buchneri]|uniref:hypothetical protein n=1 Tax=Candidatus Curculioniphilus buchneri TaxID=690594 RepID=UPI00376EE48B
MTTNNKFQNRLVGTVVLIFLNIAILPNLLNGRKKCCHDSFYSIPLVPLFSGSHQRFLTNNQQLVHRTMDVELSEDQCFNLGSYPKNFMFFDKQSKQLTSAQREKKIQKLNKELLKLEIFKNKINLNMFFQPKKRC